MPSIRAFSTLKELRILPINRCFTQEFIYAKEVVVKPQLNQENVLGIDHGINNWLTCVSNVGTSAGCRWETDKINESLVQQTSINY
ncbi:MAG: hypothetical protein F6K23_21495 [Okeania sp. SIO2C9]|uniref:hypothetical protein n=1 Tax=Okeania sp. SIO2C9 TaxID=2607791 RepID=UPI0013BEF8B7|nr:hypothetical protein [Okeania sp. SIO2C9]NEQ75396.1 hypothetical protein [Okeania sp. SIO2C9]